MRWSAAIMLLNGWPNLSSSDSSMGCLLAMWLAADDGGGGGNDDAPGVLAISAAMLQANHNKLADTIVASNQGLDDSKFSLRLSLTHVTQRSVTARERPQSSQAATCRCTYQSRIVVYAELELLALLTRLKSIQPGMTALFRAIPMDWRFLLTVGSTVSSAFVLLNQIQKYGAKAATTHL